MHATLARGLQQLREAGKIMIAQARDKRDEPEFAAAIAFEAGGCWRTVAEYEEQAARAAAQEEAQRMKQQRARQRFATATTSPTTQPATQPAPAQPALVADHDPQKEARACYEMILQIAPDSPTALDARAVLAEIAAAKPMKDWRAKSMRTTTTSRYELPPVLNLDGSAQFVKLDVVLRNNSPDLSDEQGAGLDEGLAARPFSLPKEN